MTTYDFHTNRAFLNAHGEEQRQLAAEARHGGRALTDKIVQRVSVLLTLPGMDQSFVNERWMYSIDPAGGGWDWIAKSEANGRDMSQKLTTLAEAEAMTEWPIYRAAFAPQVYVNYSGEDGGLDVTVTRGEAEVIEQDWDNVNGEGLVDYERADLVAMREKLSAVAQPDYRDRLVRDMDEIIERFDTITEEMS